MVTRVLARRGELVVERDPQRPSARLLRCGGMDASYVDLADASHLEFDYLRWIRIVLRAARARRVVHVGGGACALARALAVENPDSRQEVLEVDADVLDLAREHLGLRRAPGLRVRHAEGRAWLAAAADSSRDAIVVDAFVGARIPAHLITVEAMADAARVAPLALVNVVDNRGARVVREVAAAALAAYPRVWGVGGRAGNTVVLGTRSRLDLARLRPALAADPSPAQVTGPQAMARSVEGTLAQRDAEPISRGRASCR